MGGFSKRLNFDIVHCYKCNTPFGMTEDLNTRRHRDGKSFFCPNGHGQVYTESSEKKLKQENQRLQNNLDAVQGKAILLQREAEENARKYTRIRTRVQNGTCPCCDEKFDNLREHMQSRHPEFGEQKALRFIREMLGLTQKNLAEEIGVNAAYISMYENDKEPAGHAREAIEEWLENVQ